MPTTALAIPTGEEVLQVILFAAGTNPRVGMFDADTIDLDVTTNANASVPHIEFERFKTICTDNGLDHTALDDTMEYPYIWNAMRWACLYWYKDKDRKAKLVSGDKCEEEKAFMESMRLIKFNIASALSDIDVYSPDYCEFRFNISPVGIQQSDNLTGQSIS